MLMPGAAPQIHQDIPVDMSPFRHDELREAIGRLSSGKAFCKGDVPIECFKVFAEAPGPVMDELLQLFNSCLETRSVPRGWLTARVTLIFKKGDPAVCDNYRPICLTTIAYKIFAS